MRCDKVPHIVCDMDHIVSHVLDDLHRFVTSTGKSQESQGAAPEQSQRVDSVHRIVPRVGIGLPRLGHVGIDGQELPGRRIVIAPY